MRLPTFRREHRSPSEALPGGPPPDPETRFFSIWQNQAKQRQMLMTFALLSQAALIIVLVSYARLAHSSRFVPFLYVVDRSGEVMALGSAKPMPADTDGVVYFSLASFLSGVRAVYSDPVAQRAALQSAWAYVPSDNPEARSPEFLNAYLSRNDPRTLSQQIVRTADIVSILKLPQSGAETPATRSHSTWRIRWRETTYPLAIGAPTTAEWEAFTTVRVHPKKVIEAFDRNPFGVYVDQLSWSRISNSNTSSTN
jgi:type IV secretory pathway TrbF-like protein